MLANLGWVAAAVGPVALALLSVPKSLWQRWRVRLVDWLDNALRRGVTAFGRRYRDHLTAGLRYIDLKGLGVVGFHTPRFEDVFVDVSVAPQTMHDAPTDLLARLPEDADRRAVTEFLNQPEPGILAIIGVPGSGKTTLLRHLALVLCRTRRARRRVPVLLFLRHHVTGIKADEPLPTLIRAKLGRIRRDEPPEWFEKRLKEGDCVVLLDGLDEVADHDDRRRVSDWVEEQARQYPRNDFVVTSRPHGYRTAPVAGATVLQIRDFTDEQVAEFVHGWYAAMEKLSTGDSGEAVNLRAEAAAGELLRKLHANPALHDLTANPLLLTMVANVHRYANKLPDSRAELYREICEVVLWRRHEAKDLAVTLAGDRKEALLRALAFRMMSSRVRDLSGDDVLAGFRPALRRMSTSMTEQDLLADISSNGLLVERERGVFSFAHQTFQEYLAAEYARDKGSLRVLAGHVDDDWWRETILLAAARADADVIVAACLDSGSVGALTLAFDCADRAAELSPDLRSRLDDFVRLVDDPEARRVVAGVMLTRHLRAAIPVGDGQWVCERPVTAALYRLFLLDSGPLVDDQAPDEPVGGVRADDAQRFVDWAKEITRVNCRLATHAQLDHPLALPAVSEAARPVWARSDGLPDLWLPRGVAHPYAVNCADLATDVLADLERVRPLFGLLLLAGARNALRTHAEKSPGRRGRLPEIRLLLKCRRLFPESLMGDLVHFDIHVAIYERSEAKGGDSAVRREVENLIAELETLIDRVASDPALSVILPIVRLGYVGWEVGYVMMSLLQRITQAELGAEDPFTWFARWFVDATGIGRRDWVPKPDGASAWWSALTRKPHPDWGSDWHQHAEQRLHEYAWPALTGGLPITDESAATIRLVALCLAGEADANGQPELGDRYRCVAAWVTVLQRRATGRSPVNETIVLAVDRHNR